MPQLKVIQDEFTLLLFMCLQVGFRLSTILSTKFQLQSENSAFVIEEERKKLFLVGFFNFFYFFFRI